MAIAGLPPLNGFASEWLTLQSLLHAALHRPVGAALVAGAALASLAATAALALLCFVKVAGLALLGAPRRPECEAATDPGVGMRAAVAFLAALCVLLGVVPGVVLPTLEGLAPAAPAAGGAVWTRHLGLIVPGTGSYPALGVALALAVLTFVLVRLRGSRRAVSAPTWACGQPVVPALNWTSAAFTKPLRLVLEPLFRPERTIEVVSKGGIVQSVTYSGHIPSLVDTILYAPAIRAGLRTAALVRRLQTGSVRTYAAYLLGLVLGLLALARIGGL